MFFGKTKMENFPAMPTQGACLGLTLINLQKFD